MHVLERLTPSGRPALAGKTGAARKAQTRSAAVFALQRAAGNVATSRLVGSVAGSRLQRIILDGQGREMQLGDVVDAVTRDPSAEIKTAGAREKLREMSQTRGVRYTIAEILEALGGGPRTVERPQGSLTLHPPLDADRLPLSAIAGTHASVARGFSDSTHTVEGTADEIAGDPRVLETKDAFVLTVFRATKPAPRNDDIPYVWSANNRRLLAMQMANNRLGGKLPPIRVRWATKAEMEHAIGPAKLDNIGRQQVGYHRFNTQVSRRAQLASQAQYDVGAAAAALATNDADAIAEAFGL